jgi:putative protease
MAKQRVIELLAPAKDASTAIEAILHGADAVYIGASKFGARAAAGNEVSDIARVVVFAHAYHVKVYVALNVLLHDEELPEVERLIHELWSVGVDALIVQDMGITRLNLPPIPLHASTQTNNRTVEKVRFLEEAGFSQVVLARELSLEQIREIRTGTSVCLEAFIHGALCVSYSGQCYLSHAMTGRSANRGECAQWCRLPYDVYDEKGKILLRQKHVLSLKDLNATEQVESLMEAGVTSFKIEGRLKDVSYVKNVTAWYNERLNEIIANYPNTVRSSLGKPQYSFTPNPEKSFNRGFTSYFLEKRTAMCNVDTPKSMGEPVGVVRQLNNNNLVIEGARPLSNGDGISFFDTRGVMDGFRINKVEGKVVYPALKTSVKPGMQVFRTFDQQFERQMEKDKARRVIQVRIVCWETRTGFAVEMADFNNNRVIKQVTLEKTVANQPQREKVSDLFRKTGQTRFEVRECILQWSSEWFVPVSVWASLKRELCEALERVIRLAYKRKYAYRPSAPHDYPDPVLDYKGQVLNESAKAFFMERGVQQTKWAPEHPSSNHYTEETVVMLNKYCLKYELGVCPRQPGYESTRNRLGGEPAYLVYQKKKLNLHFNCKQCEMYVSVLPTENQG